MVVQVFVKSIIESASRIDAAMANEALFVMKGAARSMTDRKILRELEKIKSSISGKQHSEHTILEAKAYVASTVIKAFNILKISSELLEPEHAPEPTLYDDINAIINDEEQPIDYKQRDLLCLLMETVKPVRKKFFSDEELQSSTGRIAKNALGSVTKICMDDTENPIIRIINSQLEALFDVIPQVLRTAERVTWVKILKQYADLVTNHPTTRGDPETLTQCVSMFTNVDNALQYRQRISVNAQTRVPETSLGYMKSLLSTLTSRSKGAFMYHKVFYPELAAKVERLYALHKTIESLRYYADGAIAPYNTQLQFVSALHRYVNPGTSTAEPSTDYSRASTSRNTGDIVSQISALAYNIQKTTDRSYPATSFSLTYIKEPKCIGCMGEYHYTHVHSMLMEFQNDLRSILRDVHHFDRPTLDDLKIFVLQHNKKTSEPRDCPNRAHILNSNISHYTSLYTDIASSTIDRCTASDLSSYEKMIYVVSALLANALAIKANYSNLPEPKYFYKSIYKTQLHIRTKPLHTKKDFANHRTELEKELISCLMAIPLDGAIKVKERTVPNTDISAQNEEVIATHSTGNNYMGASTTNESSVTEAPEPVMPLLLPANVEYWLAAEDLYVPPTDDSTDEYDPTDASATQQNTEITYTSLLHNLTDETTQHDICPRSDETPAHHILPKDPQHEIPALPHTRTPSYVYAKSPYSPNGGHSSSDTEELFIVDDYSRGDHETYQLSVNTGPKKGSAKRNETFVTPCSSATVPQETNTGNIQHYSRDHDVYPRSTSSSSTEVYYPAMENQEYDVTQMQEIYESGVIFESSIAIASTFTQHPQASNLPNIASPRVQTPLSEGIDKSSSQSSVNELGSPRSTTHVAIYLDTAQPKPSSSQKKKETCTSIKKGSAIDTGGSNAKQSHERVHARRKEKLQAAHEPITCKENTKRKHANATPDSVQKKRSLDPKSHSHKKGVSVSLQASKGRTKESTHPLRKEKAQTQVTSVSGFHASLATKAYNKRT